MKDIPRLAIVTRHRLIVPLARDARLKPRNDPCLCPVFRENIPVLRKFLGVYLAPFNFSDSEIPVKHIPYLRLFI